MYNSELFMQDNASIHTAHAVKAWFNNNSLYCLISWPPYSLDLNPMEHLWPRLKELIYKLDPELDSITNKETQKDCLCQVLPRAWEQILVETIEACFGSMRSRLQAVIDAGGWHTKY